MSTFLFCFRWQIDDYPVRLPRVPYPRNEGERAERAEVCTSGSAED